MAKRASVNNFGTSYNHSEGMYQLKEFLKTWGWTVQGSGDGGANWSNAGVDWVTSGTVMNTLRAWYRIRDPGNLREFTVQRGSTSGAYRVKYSAVDRFTGGAPSATQTPSATDEKVLLGGGTDAVPTYAQLWDSTLGQTNCFYHHMVCYDDAMNGVYGFYSFAVATYNATLVSTFICDPIATGSSPAGDTDPCLLICASGNQLSLPMTAYAWHRMNMAGERFIPYTSCAYYRGSYLFYPGLAGLNPYDGDDNGVPILFGRTYYVESGVNIDQKGFAGRIRWKGSVRLYPDVVDPTGDAKVIVQSCLLPWPNSTKPLL